MLTMSEDHAQHGHQPGSEPWVTCCGCAAAQVEYPEIEEAAKPRHRFMSAFEQKKEPCDRKYQYLLFAAEPYEVISFKVPNMEIEKTATFFTHW